MEKEREGREGERERESGVAAALGNETPVHQSQTTILSDIDNERLFQLEEKNPWPLGRGGGGRREGRGGGRGGEEERAGEQCTSATCSVSCCDRLFYA